MINCPSCNHENIDGTTFCEMCGEELPADGASTAPTATGGTEAAATGASGDIKCPACENMNPADNVVCEVCGTELRPGGTGGTEAAATGADAAITDADTDPMTTADSDGDGDGDAATIMMDAPPTDDGAAASVPPADDAAAGDLPPLKPGMLKLVVEQGMSVGKQFVLGDPVLEVGREDEEEDIYPDIDLSDQDEGYVHRKHATITFENDRLYVTHLGGANRTRLNNKPIPDNQPQAVKPGDKIAFGKVVVRVLPL